MAESVGQIGLDLVVNQKGFNKQMQGITSLAKKAGVALASAFAVKKIVDFGKSAVALGSQLAEVDNVIQQAVPSMEKKIDSFAKNAIQQFGMSEIAAKRFTGVFSSMARGFGFGEESAAAMGVTLTGLAADVASFYDTSQDEAFTKLKSIFSGETESLKSLGVVMTQNALDAFALANGFKKTTKNMSEAEKVALRYAFVQDKLRFAQGDFARNSGSWANQTRILSEQFNALKASIGQGLINVFLPVIRLMNTLLSKIQVVATAFSNLTAKIFGKAEQAASGVAEGIGTATQSSIDGMGDAAKAAEKAAKKAKNATSSIDELNIIQEDKEEGSGAGSGGDIAGVLGNIGASVDESIETPLSKALEKIKKLCEDIGTAFTKGFSDQVKKVDFSRITEGLSGIGKSLKNIVSDEDVNSAAHSFVTTYAEAVGSYIGTIVAIGTNMATNLVLGVDSYLSNNSEFIKQKVVSLFNTGTALSENLIKVNDFLADISEVLTGNSAIQITANIVEIFGNGFLNILDLAGLFAVDLIDAVVTPIVNNKAKMVKAIEGTLKPIETVTSSIKDFVNDTWKTVFKAYEEHVKPAFESFKRGLSTILSSVLDGYNNYLAPVLQWIADRFSALVKEYIQPLVDAFINFAARVIEAAARIWEYLAPFIGWLTEGLFGALAVLIQGLWTIIENFVAAIASFIKTILEILSGLIDFLTGVFTGDWDKAWAGIKKMFKATWDSIKDIIKITLTFISNLIETILTAIKVSVSGTLKGIGGLFETIFNGISNMTKLVFNGIKATIVGIINAVRTGVNTSLDAIFSKFKTIFTNIKDTVSSIFGGLWTSIKGTINSILGGIESMCNGVVRGINKAVSALNSLSFDVPDWIPGIGGKSFGFSIPSLSEITIPKLAQGGYVKANTPQLAMIGDNRHQGEVVAPEDKLLEMAMKAAELVNANNRQDNTYILIVIELLKKIIDTIEALDLDITLNGKSVLEGLKDTEKRLGFQF